MIKLLNELKELEIKTGYGFSDDYLIENTLKIGQLFHKHGMGEYLKDVDTLSSFILDNVSETENKKLHVYASYFLKKYTWLAGCVKMAYLRPDIEFLPRILYMPEVITAEDFIREFGEFIYTEKPYGKHDNSMDSFIYVSTYNSSLLKEFNQVDKKKFASFYIKPSNGLISKMNKNFFNLFYNEGEYRYPLTIEIVEHDNGMVLVLVNGSNCIGTRYASYIKVGELLKACEKAHAEYVNNFSKI